MVRSVGAIVASMIQALTKKEVNVPGQHAHQDFRDNLLHNLTKILRKYNDRDGVAPW